MRARKAATGGEERLIVPELLKRTSLIASLICVRAHAEVVGRHVGRGLRGLSLSVRPLAERAVALRLILTHSHVTPSQRATESASSERSLDIISMVIACPRGCRLDHA